MRRLSLSLLFVVLIATIGLGWVVDRLFDGLGDGAKDSLQLYKNLGQSLVGSTSSSSALTEIVRLWPQDRSVTLRIVGQDEMALPQLLQQQMVAGEPLVVESEQDVTLFFAIPGSHNVLSLTPPADGPQTRLRFFLTVLFYGGVNLLILLWIAPLARRLIALASAARAFGEGDFNKRVATSRRSFLRDIESEFNNMAQRIQHLVADNKMLASAVSHDLRTPLARLRFGIDMLDEAPNEAVRADYQQRISTDLTVMENLVDVLLEYARLDKQLGDVQKQSVNLMSIVSAGVDALSAYTDKQILWQPDAAQYITLAHERYLTMLINNLLQNASHYGNSIVQVSLTRRRNRIVFSVEDDGPGIPLVSRADVLKPFVRGNESAVNKRHKGYGMGLAIVNRIAAWHEADFVIADSRALGGARFDVSFTAKQ